MRLLKVGNGDKSNAIVPRDNMNVHIFHCAKYQSLPVGMCVYLAKSLRMHLPGLEQQYA